MELRHITTAGMSAAVIPAVLVATAASAAPPPGPDPSARADAAVARADSMVGTDFGGDFGCGVFVAAAYGVPGIGYETAKLFRDALAAQNKIVMSPNPPRGALVFSESSWDRGAGHVDIARGDGTYVSGGVDKGTRPSLGGAGHNVQVLRTWNPASDARYLGWAYAPW